MDVKYRLLQLIRRLGIGIYKAILGVLPSYLCSLIKKVLVITLSVLKLLSCFLSHMSVLCCYLYMEFAAEQLKT